LAVLLTSLTSRPRLKHVHRIVGRGDSDITFVVGTGSPYIEDESPAVGRVVTHTFDSHDLTSALMNLQIAAGDLSRSSIGRPTVMLHGGEMFGISLSWLNIILEG
jgi:hypothetical protein